MLRSNMEIQGDHPTNLMWSQRPKKRLASGVFIVFCTVVFGSTFLYNNVHGERRHTRVGRSLIQCTEPHIDHGTIYRDGKDGGLYNIGDQIVMQCDDNFQLLGQSWLKCTGAGNWSDNPPYCHVVKCNQIPQIQYGTYSPNPLRSDVGDVVNVTCDKGFMHVGPTQLTCNIRGIWMPEVMPYCIENNTTHLDAIQTEVEKLRDLNKKLRADIDGMVWQRNGLIGAVAILAVLVLILTGILWRRKVQQVKRLTSTTESNDDSIAMSNLGVTERVLHTTEDESVRSPTQETVAPTEAAAPTEAHVDVVERGGRPYEESPEPQNDFVELEKHQAIHINMI